jgi:hypothetical protein
VFFVVYDLVRLATGFDQIVNQIVKIQGFVDCNNGCEGPRELVCKKFPFRDLAFAGALAGGSTH